MISANPAGAPTRIRAVATAYHPDERLSAVVDAALESCLEVIVVDNTPTASPRWPRSCTRTACGSCAPGATSASAGR